MYFLFDRENELIAHTKTKPEILRKLKDYVIDTVAIDEDEVLCAGADVVSLIESMGLDDSFYTIRSFKKDKKWLWKNKYIKADIGTMSDDDKMNITKHICNKFNLVGKNNHEVLIRMIQGDGNSLPGVFDCMGYFTKKKHYSYVDLCLIDNRRDSYGSYVVVDENTNKHVTIDLSQALPMFCKEPL